MSDATGTTRKQEADYTQQCDEAIPAAEQLAQEGKVQEALDKLLALEKPARNASDLPSTSRILVAIISILFSRRDLEQLNAHLQLLSKKHGQLRLAVVKMVDKAMEFVPELEGKDKLELIETLRDITEGKIYLEVQRARITRTLAQIREAEGDINAASELMQDLQVETFGSMERREKVDFILEQMRLLKLQEDWEKMAIVAKRINLRWLADKEHEDLKLRYYALMILHGLYNDKYLEVTKYYRAVYDTPSIADNAEAAAAVLRNIVFFVVLAPYDNEQSDLLARVYKDDRLKEMKESYDLVKCFIDPELRRWPNIEELYGEALRRTKVFGPKGVEGVVGDIEEEVKHAKGDQRWKVLHDRIVEHNIRVVAGYYTRITLARLASFLNLPVPEAEQFLSRLVVSKTVYAKIDRPAGLVSFVRPRKGEEVLNDWSSDVGKLMGLIEKSCHLIAKEHAVHAALKAQQAKA
ncbi:SPOSA6832_04744, partial [Sporobolomyces salmonicolor]